MTFKTEDVHLDNGLLDEKTYADVLINEILYKLWLVQHHCVLDSIK